VNIEKSRKKKSQGEEKTPQTKLGIASSSSKISLPQKEKSIGLAKPG